MGVISKISIKQLNFLKSFKKFTGFTINTSKTSLLKIRAARDFDQLDHFTENVRESSTINVLGVDIIPTTNSKEMCEINYDKTVKKAQAILNSWCTRGLSLMGKIQIVNTLVASLFVYKMSVLPKMPTKFSSQLQAMIEKFIWNNAKPKIKTIILQLHKKAGGANLTNFELKDASLKAAWVKNLNNNSLVRELAYKELSPTLTDTIWKCNICCQDVIKILPNSFWRDVLEEWAKFNFNSSIINYDEVMNQVIWYNSEILVNKRPILFSNAYKKWPYIYAPINWYKWKITFH